MYHDSVIHETNEPFSYESNTNLDINTSGQVFAHTPFSVST